MIMIYYLFTMEKHDKKATNTTSAEKMRNDDSKGETTRDRSHSKYCQLK